MNRILRIILSTIVMISISTSVFAKPKQQVLIKTNVGEFLVELDHLRAPSTVVNFLQYVDDKFYDGTVFHRVITNFMIQGGGFDENYIKKATRGPVRNESTNGLNNSTGTIAMARTDDIDSATSQFYINLKHNRQLNGQYKKPGYTVFGKILGGMDVVKKIANVETGSRPYVGEDVPLEPIIIISIRRVDAPKKSKVIVTRKPASITNDNGQ